MNTSYWVFAIATLALLVFISHGTFATARLLRQWRPDQNLLLIPAENLVRFLFIVVCIILGLVSGVRREQLGWVWTNLGTQILWGVALGVTLAFGFSWMTRRLVSRSETPLYSSVVIEAIAPHNGRELILVLLAMGPVVLLEELLFRSLLIGGFSIILPTSLLLVGWSILFGLLHSPQGILGMVGAGLAGLLLGGLFLYQGSLVLPLITHYTTNAIQIIQAMRLGYGRGEMPSTGRFSTAPVVATPPRVPSAEAGPRNSDREAS